MAEEIALAAKLFPQVKEFFFDDDTFTDDLPRAEAIARRLGPLGVTWSVNAKANVPYATLKVLRDNGLRLLLVGYESGNQEILNRVKKGVRLDVARRFTRDAKALGITIHGTFILGLPGETRETIEETIRFAGEIDPHTIQVSLAAPYPGHRALRGGAPQRLARGRLAGRRRRGAAERARVPASAARGDLRLGGSLLPALLPSAAKDDLADGGGASRSCHPPPPALTRAATSSASCAPADSARGRVRLGEARERVC